MMCHYAILDASGDGDVTSWLEAGSHEQYMPAHNAGDIPGQV